MFKNQVYCPIDPVDTFRPLYSPHDNLAPFYKIDRFGNVFSNQYGGGFLSHIITDRGYHVVSLQEINGRRIQRKVHRLVMMTFCYFDGCEELEVDHKNGDKSNNSVTNLEWVTGKVNVERAINNGLRTAWSNDNNPKAIVSSTDALKIIDLALNGLSDEEILIQVPNANISIISNIVLGNTWTNIISKDKIDKIKSIRHPEILSYQQKHMICKYYQDNIKYDMINTYGYVTNFVKQTLIDLFGNYTDSTFRMAKRLFYRYQDDDITSLYKY